MRLQYKIFSIMTKFVEREYDSQGYAGKQFTKKDVPFGSIEKNITSLTSGDWIMTKTSTVGFWDLPDLLVTVLTPRNNVKSFRYKRLPIVSSKLECL